MRAGKVASAFAVCLMLVVGCGKQDRDADKDNDKGGAKQGQLTLAPDDVAQLGIKTVSIQAANYIPDVRGYGTVVSIDALAQSVADLASAEAAVRQSRAALEHNNALAADKLITREALEVARRQAATDNAQLMLAERKQVVDFGRNAPWRAAGGGNIIEQLSAGRLVLVRISYPTGAGPAPQTITVERVGRPSETWKATRVWEAPADPNLPGQGYFALIAGSTLAAGERVLARMPVGAPTPGVLVPEDAAVLSGDSAWCYTEPTPGKFVRHPLDTTRVMNGGYFELGDLKPGQLVVVQGASLLLAHELNPSSGDKD